MGCCLFFVSDSSRRTPHRSLNRLASFTNNSSQHADLPPLHPSLSSRVRRTMEARPLLCGDDILRQREHAGIEVPSSFDAAVLRCRSKFATELRGLKCTEKAQITALTRLADEYGQANCSDVVDLISSHMQRLPSGDCRLPLMYLVDSICQNLGKKVTEYPKRMRAHVKPMLQSMFKHCSLRVKYVYHFFNRCTSTGTAHTKV